MRLFVMLLLVVFGLAAPAWSQSFGPKDYADCVMLYAKRPQSRDARMLTRLACKCRFQDPKAEECRQYSQAAVECLVINLQPVEKDVQAWGIERACRTKNPIGK